MSLIDELSAAIDAADKKNTVVLHADADIRVPTDKAVSIGVIVTELLTNAYKYAYPAAMRGEIRVILQKIGEDTVSLAVEDDGVGWKGSGAAQGTGLGTRVVTAMAANLQSKLEYDTGVEGTRASLRFRL